MAKLTKEGIQTERLETIVEQISDGFRAIYGQNINLSPDTPDGQMIGILAQMKMDLEELSENVYKQLDPDLATGSWLEQRVAYAGLVRKQASYSYLRSVILTGEAHTPLYAGLIVSDVNKVRWILTQNVRLNASGAIRADFRSEELGAFNLLANQPLNIETITLGLHNAITSEAAEIGQEEESDAQLRQRFMKSRSKNAQNSAEAIEGEIGVLPDVKNVIVLENNTNQRDKFGVEPHTLNVIVDGGNDVQIAEIIYQNKGVGVGLQGRQQVILNRGEQRRTILFDRSTPVDIDIEMVLVRYEDFTEIDQTEIKRRLATVKFKIGQPVSLSRLYTPINTVTGFWVKTLKIARLGQTRQAENISLQPRELARISATNIHIRVE